MRFGYARVSTAKQDLTRQITALENVNCNEIYSDVQSGKNMERAELKKLLSKIRDLLLLILTDLEETLQKLRNFIQN